MVHKKSCTTRMETAYLDVDTVPKLIETDRLFQGNIILDDAMVNHHSFNLIPIKERLLN